MCEGSDARGLRGKGVTGGGGFAVVLFLPSDLDHRQG